MNSVYARRTLETSRVRAPTPQGKLTLRAREKLIAQIDELEESRSPGTLGIAPGVSLTVTSLAKVFFPREKLTKGDLMRYYVSAAPFILPVMADRPLVLQRFPNGVNAKSFFQQNAGEAPPEVRTAKIRTEGGSLNRRIVGGDIATLLYTVQLGSVSVDPWHSRVNSLDTADYSIIDLDPGPRAPFRRVVEVALWTREVMSSIGLHGAIKTSGSSGLHVYIPLPPGTPNEAATLLARIVATRISGAHPRSATIERTVNARGTAKVYVDYLQNIIGKTVAAAYSVRAHENALVSTPLDWDELTDDLHPGAFTLETAPQRFSEVGDLWGKAMKKTNSLRALVEKV